MHNRVVAPVVFAEFMNLGVAVMAARNTVVRPGSLDLIVFQFTVLQALFFVTGLEETTPAAAAVIVRPVGNHVNEVLCPHDRLDHETQIIGNGVPVTLAYNLARILNRKLDLQLLVPVGVDLEFAFPDPFCVVFVNVLDFKVVVDVEFFQSCQD